jgi:hypothetical protein
MEKMTRHLTTAFAMLVTLVGVAMAGAAAAERGTTVADRILITSTAVALALGAHLLPALARRRPAAWLLWVGCVVATLYGHAHFFAAAGERAGSTRASVVAKDSAPQQAVAMAAELAAIQARPLTIVASDHATAVARHAQAKAAAARCESATPGRCNAAQAAITATEARKNALAAEESQARRAADLRRELAAEAGRHDEQMAVATLDPIDRAIGEITGWSKSTIALATSLMQSMLVELLAAVLWVLALPSASNAAPSPRSRASGQRHRQTLKQWLMSALPASAPAKATQPQQSPAVPTARVKPARPKARDRPATA